MANNSKLLITGNELFLIYKNVFLKFKMKLEKKI